MSEENDQWIKSFGTIVVEEGKQRIAVSLGLDFILYYSYLIQNEIKQTFGLPKYHGHISIFLPLHGNLNFKLAEKYHGKVVDFEYNPAFMIGGKKSGIPNYWMKVRSAQIEKIKKDLKIVDKAEHLGLHITIMNAKNGIKKFQKQIIKIQ